MSKVAVPVNFLSFSSYRLAIAHPATHQQQLTFYKRLYAMCVVA